MSASRPDSWLWWPWIGPPSWKLEIVDLDARGVVDGLPHVLEALDDGPHGLVGAVGAVGSADDEGGVAPRHLPGEREVAAGRRADRLRAALRHGGVHDQRAPGLDTVAAEAAVPAEQGVDRDLVAGGDPRQRLAARDGVVDAAEAVDDADGLPAPDVVGVEAGVLAEQRVEVDVEADGDVAQGVAGADGVDEAGRRLGVTALAGAAVGLVAVGPRRQRERADRDQQGRGAERGCRRRKS